MSKFIFDLEDGQYWLAGPQGALYFHTEGEEGINISEAGIGIRKLEKYEEDSKMSRKCADCKYFAKSLSEEPCNHCFRESFYKDADLPKFEPAVPESTAKAEEDSKVSVSCADCKYFSTKLTEEPCSLCAGRWVNTVRI